MNSRVVFYAQLSGFRLNVKANRFGCDTEFARAAHDKLIAYLDDAISHVQQVLKVEKQLTATSNQAEIVDLSETLFGLNNWFNDRYVEGAAIPLVDFLYVDESTNEWCDKSGKWHYLDTAPEMRDVANKRLYGLRRIMNAIRSETGMNFSAYELKYH